MICIYIAHEVDYTIYIYIYTAKAKLKEELFVVKAMSYISVCRYWKFTILYNFV